MPTFSTAQLIIIIATILASSLIVLTMVMVMSMHRKQTKTETHVDDIKKLIKGHDQVFIDMANTKLHDMARFILKNTSMINKNVSEQLQMNQVILRRLAEITRDPEDINAAEMADKLYKEHEAEQSKLSIRIDKSNATQG